MLRTLDILFAALGLIFGLPIFIVLTFAGFADTGVPFFVQTRVGKAQRLFKLVKFRTMRPDTASVATHLADPSAVTKFGRFLRGSKLDELPQLWNVLIGDMSLVGPRPCLPNQVELIKERATRNVFDAKPGITGLAQTRGIDMSTPRLLAETDARMLETLNIQSYFTYILQTVAGSGSGDRIKPN